ncbi:glycosyltransferase family 2 protein [Frigoriglobus tundricola]|uniref:GT2 family glycosyltransferase n=1 Tax=Frigoriglobus tundricola TaxID=2774151 RepID=A0A6M5YVY7_9BACT|nr:glycosyltransferase family 2 protein [Frigoriglobus tundricola]QJW98257.1 GT2 family glycosyltransferase [Frigoriglobus tundricola]
MRDSVNRRRRRRNPYTELLHLLNQRYHAEFVRAELLQNDLTGLQGSKFARVAEWLRVQARRLFPHPAAVTKSITEHAAPYTGPVFPAPADARVSIVIPFRDRPELLRNCLRSIRRSTFRRIEIVLVDNGSEDPRTGRLLARAGERLDVRLVSRPGPFNFSLLCNAGAAAATGDHLVFLNNDTEVLSRQWLERLLGLAADPAVGAVGATLLFPDRTIQHAGLLPRSDGMWVHPYQGRPADDPGAGGELRTVRIVPAATAACLMVRRDRFEEAGGFDERMPVTHNDVDLCRRIRARGRVVVVTPRARLLHYEGLSRGYTVDPPPA